MVAVRLAEPKAGTATVVNGEWSVSVSGLFNVAGGSNACDVGNNGACAYIENNGGGNHSVVISGGP